jgi:hypothetical protein
VGRISQLDWLLKGEDMDSLRFASDGFSIGSFLVPSFRLRAGECVCLHLPDAMTSSEVEKLILALTGRTPLAGIRLLGRVHWAAPLRNRRHGLTGLFRPMRVVDWLSQIAGASPAQTEVILLKLQMNERHCRIEQLAGTPRTLLSMEGGWLAGAQVVVFTTAGLDPLGRETVYQAVASHFPHGSAIHLSFPFLQNGQRRRECFAGATCLELSRCSEPLHSVTTMPRAE